MANKKFAGQKGQWFTMRQGFAKRGTQNAQSILLPILDVSKVRSGVLSKISNTKRDGIPKHMEHIKDISDANTRFFLQRRGADATFAVALDHEAMVMLRQAGGILQERPYRHEPKRAHA